MKRSICLILCVAPALFAACSRSEGSLSDGGADVVDAASVDPAVDLALPVDLANSDAAAPGLFACVSSAWSTSRVDSIPLLSDKDVAGTSIAVDDNGIVSVAYEMIGSTTGNVRVATLTNGSWSAVDVDTSADGSGDPWLILGTGGAMSTLWSDDATGLWYAYLPAGGSWTTENLMTTGASHAMIGDSSGALNLFYGNDAGSMYLRIAGGQSTPTAVGTAAMTEPSMAVDGAGTVYLAYRDFNAMSLVGCTHYATKAAGASAFTDVLVDSIGTDCGFNPSLAVDPAGTVHLTYSSSSTAENLYYTEKPASANWSTPERIDLADGRPDSLVVDDDGTVYVSYFDSSTGAIKVAGKRPGGAWSIQVIAYVDMPTNIDIIVPGPFGNGLPIGNALTLAGHELHVAYYAPLKYELEYAHCP